MPATPAAGQCPRDPDAGNSQDLQKIQIIFVFSHEPWRQRIHRNTLLEVGRHRKNLTTCQCLESGIQALAGKWGGAVDGRWRRGELTICSGCRSNDGIVVQVWTEVSLRCGISKPSAHLPPVVTWKRRTWELMRWQVQLRRFPERVHRCTEPLGMRVLLLSPSHHGAEGKCFQFPGPWIKKSYPWGRVSTFGFSLNDVTQSFNHDDIMGWDFCRSLQCVCLFLCSCMWEERE